MAAASWTIDIAHDAQQVSGFTKVIVQQGCYIALILLVVLYARQFDSMKSRLSVLVDERTQELSQANHRLQDEIGKRMTASNERDLAKQDLEEALETRSKQLADNEQALMRNPMALPAPAGAC